MVENRQLRQTKQLKFDKSMLVVGLFALFGGLLVFTSYAAQKPQTTKPGVIDMTALPKKGIYFQFDLSNMVKYCFESPEKYAKVTVYEAGKRAESHSLDSNCFATKKEYKEPVISITGVAVDSKLTITKN